MSRRSPFIKVEALMDKLSKDYPALNKTVIPTISHRSTPVGRNMTPVRPTIPPDFAIMMLKENTKFAKIKDLKLAKPPKRPTPLTVKVHEYEAETSLNCFMKHIATESYERYLSERAPGFRKGKEIYVKIPEGNAKKRKRKVGKMACLSPSNLELLGQKEFSNTQPEFIKKNLTSVNRRLQKTVKNWCLAEMKKKSTDLQLIDHYTFRSKH
ncbi:unnamed protein product [Blepharisma stoltei]|uniref:Uncharacterized protein n=1 Tax=Blepharisma stoltei TaxID=1481888 RepID=A0AAU9JIT0_9CILI|nr:unnamed protein product [Blepharisma stoltei]